ncbi:3585_t:CDS:2 [Racocetra persica]|uniref:3585_t:CDS:1 n=1 Tax=Racocetra persica TaxID=160502 RepID=A0ACA9RY18_9GLOM|nr:3585_t:CDS:2 [Racocetra persica]
MKVKYLYNEARNTFLEEEAVKPDLCGCIVDASVIEYPLLQQFLGNNLDLFTW